MLLNYPHAPAPRGSRLTPEVAQGFPRISRNGLIYTFTLKRTFRLSNGQPLTARNFAWAINRALQKRMASPAQPFIEDIAGASAVIDGRAQRASGVTTPNAYTLRIRMAKRAPDLLARLAMPFFCGMPSNLPVNADGVSAPVVGSGPYFIKEWTKNRLAPVVGQSLSRTGPILPEEELVNQASQGGGAAMAAPPRLTSGR